MQRAANGPSAGGADRSARPPVPRLGGTLPRAAVVSASTLSISALGPVEVTGRDGPLPLRGRRERVVLTALALRAGETVAAERLAMMLWGDDAPRTSAKVVQNVVLRLRRAIGDGAIESRPTGYLLRVERDAIDVHRFDRLWREGREHLRADRLDEAAAALTAARALWRGAPLGDLGEHPAVRAEVERLSEQYRDASEELGEVALRSGRHRDWLPAFEAMVVEEPLRERRWGQLLLALHRCGRQADALRAFQRARLALADVGLVPGPDLCALERRVASAEADDAVGAVEQAAIGNVPRPLTVWIGPVDRLHRCVDDVARHRLTTLTGPGGVGKTRLALEVAAASTARFPDGVWVVDLSPVADPSAVVGHVASSLALRADGSTPLVDTLVDWLRRRSVLVVLDNCEHLMSAVTALVSAVTDRCPATTVLATSREPLGLVGERVTVVPPMTEADACELFCERVRAADDTVVVTQHDRATIEAICRKLDGMPLAIELAAVRVRSSSFADLLLLLDDRFRMLRLGLPNGGGRHETLQATVAWSYQLLGAGAQRVFDRASVFAGGFDAAAARAVVADEGADEGTDDGTDGADVDEALDELVRKSMVTVDRGADRLRFALLETLRQFGAERLDDRAETTELRDRHLAYFAALARRTAAVWAGPRQAEANAVFAQEWNNIRSAVRWATGADLVAAASLIDATGAYAESGTRNEHTDWVHGLLAAGPPGYRHGATTYGWAAGPAFRAEDAARAIELARAGIAGADEPGGPETVSCRCALVLSLGQLRQPDAAATEAAALAALSERCTDAYPRHLAFEALIEQAFWYDLAAAPALVRRFVAWAGSVGAPSMIARAAYAQGRAHMWATPTPDADSALRCYDAGVRVARAAGDISGESLILLGPAFTHLYLASDDAATASLLALARIEETGLSRGVMLLLDALAPWFLAQGDLGSAALVCGFLEAASVSTGHRDRVAVAERLDRLRTTQGGPELLAAGAALSRGDIVAEVLARLARR